MTVSLLQIVPASPHHYVDYDIADHGAMRQATLECVSECGDRSSREAKARDDFEESSYPKPPSLGSPPTIDQPLLLLRQSRSYQDVFVGSGGSPSVPSACRLLGAMMNLFPLLVCQLCYGRSTNPEKLPRILIYKRPWCPAFSCIMSMCTDSARRECTL